MGTVIGATVLGPQLVEQIPGFAKYPLDINRPKMTLAKKNTPFTYKPQSSKPKYGPRKLINKSNPVTRWRMANAFRLSIPTIGDLTKRVEYQIWRISNGKFKIQSHNVSTLITPKQIFDAVSSGNIEAAFSSPTQWSDKVSALGLFSAVPFGPSAHEYMAWFYFSDGQKIFNDIYHKRGIHSLICGMSGPEASGWFKKEIRTLEDLNGLNMRISGLGAKVMQKLGVQTQTISDSDVFNALETGLLDAAEFYQPAIDLQLGLHKVASNYYFPSWHQPATLFEIIINLNAWEALSATQKFQLEAVCGDNVLHSLAQSEAIQFNALKQMISEGVKLQTWPKEILSQLQAAWQDVVEDESLANENFKHVWRSQKTFREEFSIWHELTQP
jgi:TRAP-type mannitol/chloroaromatic compound transport system substrate-binding protein